MTEPIEIQPILSPENGVRIKDELINPPRIKGEFVRKRLGALGIGRFEQRAAAKQRREFLYDSVDAMGQGGFSINDVIAYDLQLTQDDYASFGYMPLDAVDSDYHVDFHKENDENLQSFKQKDAHDWYRIVDTADGDTLFLKTAAKRAKKSQGLYEAWDMSQNLREVFAAQVANYIGYPVPETWPVTHDNKPWLASRYIKNHIYKTHSKIDTNTVSNPEDVVTRRIYNLLVGSSGDCSNQGLIDPSNNRYYAQDVTMWFFKDEAAFTPEEVLDKLRRSISGERKDPFEGLMFLFDDAEKVPEEYRDHAFKMLERIKNMTDEDAQNLFAFGRGELSDPNRIKQILQKRAAALEVMLKNREV